MLYWDWSGKEAQSSLCPLGFWIQFNLVRFVPYFGWIRFSFYESWARDDEWFSDDWVTLCSDSNTSNLVLIPLESRVHSNRSSWRSKENPRFAWNSSIPPKPWCDLSIPFLDMFTSPLWSCLQNLSSYGLDLTLQSSKFPKVTGWKNISGLCFSYHRMNRRV